jgi:hypothetical protein
MPQPIAYNTGSQTSGSLKLNGIEYAISSSIVSGSNGQRWFTSVNPGNGIVLVTNSFTQSYSTYQNSTPLFYTASALTAAAITSSINSLPDRFGLPQFTDTASAFAWVANNRKYFMMNYEYPQIVTDGLIVLNDAKFLASYPTTQSTWYDVSGNNKNGSLINGPLFDSNRGAIIFDGVNETVNYGTGNTFFPLPSFSIELTFQSKGTVPTTGTSPGLFGFTFGIRLQVETTSLSYQISSGSTAGAYPLSTNDNVNYRDGGRWYTVVCQTDATSSRIYVNGQFKNSRSLIWSGSTVWPTNGWNLGRDNNNPNQFFTGSISNFKIYNKILSQAEINQNYYQGPIVTDGLVFAVDAGNIVSYESGSTLTYQLTGSVNSGSLTNGVTFLSNTGGVWDFDGTDDFINFGNSAPINFIYTDPFSTEVWMKWDGGSQPDNSGHLIGKTFSNYRSFLITATNPGYITFRLDSNGQTTNTPSIISPNLWYHVVCTWNPTTFNAKIFVNGVELASTINTLTDWTSTAANFQIGNSPGENYYFNGNIAIGRVYNKTLSQSEISQNFQAQRSRFGL